MKMFGSFLLGALVVLTSLHFFSNPLNISAAHETVSTSNHGSTISPKNFHVCFSPRGNCTDLIVRALNEAKLSVLVQAYSFTSDPIAEALVNAHKRQISVDVILDKSQLHGKGVDMKMLSDAGVSVEIDSDHAIAHNKVMIIDSETVITGSFNFTNAAEKSNAENLLIIQDKNLAQSYADNWQKHRSHSKQQRI